MKRAWIFVAVVVGLASAGAFFGVFRRPESHAGASPVLPQPRVEVPKNNFDFGVLEAGQAGRHRFVVRNVGQADLTLKLRDTSCKCTLAKLERTVIRPGASTEIELEWKAEEPNEVFYQGAKIETNDPQLRSFDLRVEGRIRNRLGAWPETIFFVDVPRNAKRSLHVQLYSQFFDQVKLTKIKSSLPEATARLTDVTPQPTPFETRFIHDLEIEYAAGSKPGPFRGWFDIEYEGTDREGRVEHGSFRLDFEGDKVGDFSLHGRKSVGKMLFLGTFAQATGATERAYVHFRGEATDLKLSVVKVTPDFVQVKIGEPQQLSPTMTRFPVEVSAPPGCPLVNHSSEVGGLGSVVLATTHPDYPEIRFQLTLVVMP